MTQERMDALAKLGTKIAKDSYGGFDEELSFTEAEYAVTAECLFALPHYMGSDSWNGEELHYLMEAIRTKNLKLCTRDQKAYRVGEVKNKTKTSVFFNGYEAVLRLFDRISQKVSDNFRGNMTIDKWRV